MERYGEMRPATFERQVLGGPLRPAPAACSAREQVGPDRPALGPLPSDGVSQEGPNMSKSYKIMS